MDCGEKDDGIGLPPTPGSLLVRLVRWLGRALDRAVCVMCGGHDWRRWRADPCEQVCRYCGVVKRDP